MSIKNNLNILVQVDLKSDLLEYCRGSFQKIGLIKKIIYVVKKIFYKLGFISTNPFENCKLIKVCHGIYEFLCNNKKSLNERQFKVIKSKFEFLRDKAIERKKQYVENLNYLHHCINELEEKKVQPSQKTRKKYSIFSFFQPLVRREKVQPDFVGIDKLIEAHRIQLVEFENWKKNGQWQVLHSSHFDWWMFPIKKTSRGQGGKYTVNSDHIHQLLQNQAFVRNYRLGVKILLESWGWDVNNHKMFDKFTNGQKWDNHEIRLYKVLLSVISFGQNDLVKEVRAFANKLIQLNQLNPSKELFPLLVE